MITLEIGDLLIMGIPFLIMGGWAVVYHIISDTRQHAEILEELKEFRKEVMNVLEKET